MSTHQQEINEGKRFQFGMNWQKFLKTLNEEQILDAERSLQEMLSVDNLMGKNFLDIGSGSGLFSLAARRMGATVFSFDFDPQSVACTQKLRQTYFPEDSQWTVREGSVLDQVYLGQLGQFDYVYSWGVLHHTGDQWSALNNVDAKVKVGGKLFIALYNYQPFASRYWTWVKRSYSKYVWTRPFLIFIHLIYPTLPKLILNFLRPKKNYRGMRVWTDLLDWLGGYPFEVSTPEQVFEFYKQRSYQLDKIRTVGGKLGCNEYVFVKTGVA